MGGFDTIKDDDDETVLYADNASFDGTERGGILSADGELWIGNAASPKVRKGAIVSSGLTVGYSAPDITIEPSGSAIGQTITGDTGGPLSPTLGNWNILGGSGSKTEGASSTLTVRSPPYKDEASSTTVAINSGSFATNAITLTTPASAGLLDGDLLEFVATNGALVIQLAATQAAHLGIAATSVAGTISGTATGDSITLRYQASSNDWWATSSVGIWILA